MISLPKEILKKQLDNDVKSKELTAKVAIETSKTNRWILVVFIFMPSKVMLYWDF